MPNDFPVPVAIFLAGFVAGIIFGIGLKTGWEIGELGL